MEISSKTFNTLRLMAEFALPALATLVGTVLALFAVPASTIAIAVGVVAAVNVAVGAAVKYFRAKN